MADMTVEYRDFQIEFNSQDDRWRVEINGTSFYNEDIKVLKKKIAAFHKGKVEAITAIVRGGSYYDKPFQAVKITSITEDGDIWVTYAKTKRRERMHRGSSLYVPSEENKKVIAAYIRLETEIARLQSEKAKLVGSLEVLDLTKYGVPVPEKAD